MEFDPNICFNERDVESKFVVQYLLPELGYTPDTWHQEVTFGNVRLDFIAFASKVISFIYEPLSSLSLVIETKHPNENLDKHQKQLKNYLVSLRVEHGLLTNGKEVRIYKFSNGCLNLVYRCFCKGIEREIGLIKEIVGRENLQNSYLKKNDVLSLPIEPQRQNQKDWKKGGLRKMKSLAIYHNKGGVGKTTIATNLAAAFRNQGMRVLLIDIDSQSNSTFATGLIKFQFEEDDNIRDNNVSHILSSGELYPIPDIARSSNMFNSPEIDVVPSHISLIEKQETFTKRAASRLRLNNKIQQVHEQYDIVIVDAPPSRDIYAEVTLIAVDHLIIPSDLKPFANQGLSTVKEYVSEINETRESIGKEPLNIMGVLPSKISTNSKYRQYALPKQKETVKEHYGLPLMDSMISERAVLSNCVNQTIEVGNIDFPDPKSVFEFDANSDSAQEFNMLANEILKKMGEA